MLQVQSPFQQLFDTAGKPLDAGSVYIGTVNLNPETNPISVYWDAAGTQPAAQPLKTLAGQIVRNGTPTRVYTSLEDYSITVKDKKGKIVFTVLDATTMSTLQTNLASSSGASLIGYISPSTGAVAATAAAKFGEALDAINDFGADNTGATNTTAALLAFYNACIASGKKGRIRAGTYKVTPGVLKFNSGGLVDKAWPNIETDGNLAVIFLVDSATNVDAPILEITTVATNGIQGSATYTFWKGGSHGGFSITDNTGHVAPNRVGVQLTGIWYTKFGLITGNNLRSDLVRLPLNALAGPNPDPFGCAFINVEGLSTFSCQGWTMNNMNGVGLDSWEVGSISSVYGVAGVWFGVGQGCKLHQFSVSGSSGWAFDDGTQSGSTGGNRLTIDVAELDNPQYGIRVNKLADFELKQLRINHRYNFSPLNSSGKYWPLVCLDITGGSSPNVNRGYIDVFNRIESGSTLANLGKFLDCHAGSSIYGLHIDTDYADNGGLGVTDAWITANSNISQSSSVVRVSRKTHDLFNSLVKDVSSGIGNAATTLIANTGWGTSAAKVSFGVAQANPSMGTQYNLATSTYTAPKSGLYMVQTSIPLTCAIGTRVRIGFLTTAQGAQNAITQYQVNAGNQTYVNTGFVFLNAGDTVYVVADQNTASNPLATTPQTNQDECRFVVVPL
jgi:hypothetical protein